MFEFAWPWLFVLLPLPWLVRTLAPPVAEYGSELSVPFYQELEQLERAAQVTGWKRWLSQVTLYSLIWLLLILACARPQLHGELQQRPITGRDLLIAVDVSSSMLYSDMTLDGNSLSRMDFVKVWLDNFIAQRQGDRIGLILFGSQAYLQAPLTYDHQSVRTWVQEAQPGIAGTTTAIGDAIGLAIKRLRQRPAEQRVLLLITDGANNSGVMSPAAAAQLAARYQIKIYPLGIGSSASSDLEKLTDSSSLELDEQSLMDIAQLTAGQYFHVTDSNDFIDIQHSLSQLEPSSSYQAPQRKISELYHWPLSAAFLLSLFWAAQHIYSAQRPAVTHRSTPDVDAQ